MVLDKDVTISRWKKELKDGSVIFIEKTKRYNTGESNLKSVVKYRAWHESIVEGIEMSAPIELKTNNHVLICDALIEEANRYGGFKD